MAKPEKVEKFTTSALDERVENLKELFPECFTEGKVDFEKLREVLDEVVEDELERYNFTWAGRREAIRMLRVSSSSTLIPVQQESVNFDGTQNLFIEGENLEVLKLLRKPYDRRIKVIYIDPPYNTGKEFVYPDNYRCPMDTYYQLTGQKDADGNLLTNNAETNGRYHSDWLSMMHPRLFTAKQLLRDDGLIFVSIGDHEVHNLRMLMNEIFGEENFISNIIWQNKYTRSNDAKWFSNNHEYILVFARNREKLNLNLLPRTDAQKATYSNPDNDPKGVWKATPLHAKSGKDSSFEYRFKNGVVWSPPPGTFPRYSMETFAELDENNEIWFGKDGKSVPSRKSYLSEVKSGVTPVTVWLNDEVGNTHEANNELKALLGGGVFDNPKPTTLIKQILQLSTSPSDGDIVLDFFAGSCTTADAVLDLNREDGGNRRFICVQLPEPLEPPKKLEDGTILSSVADISKERIRRAITRIQQKDDAEPPKESDGASNQIGVKVFKLSPSNYRSWQGCDEKDFDAYTQEMALFNDPLVDDWSVEDVIYEIAINEEGYGLNCRIELLENICVNTVYSVTDFDKEQAFKICLDDAIDPELPKKLNLDIQDRFICRDVALNDEQTANLALQCRLKNI